jgi:hypothetical protein
MYSTDDISNNSIATKNEEEFDETQISCQRSQQELLIMHYIYDIQVSQAVRKSSSFVFMLCT